MHSSPMSELERVLRELARLAGRLGGAVDESEQTRPEPEIPGKPAATSTEPPPVTKRPQP